jgi:hypothetical protein
MSAEVLLNKAMIPVIDEIRQLAPRQLHDLESVFWVVCWICLTRDGPGQWRQDLKKAGSPAAIIVTSIFEPESPRAGGEDKRELFGNTIIFTRDIVDNIAPYFEPLKPLVTEFYRILRTAYRNASYERLHMAVMTNLDHALEELPGEPTFVQFENISRDDLEGDSLEVDVPGTSLKLERNLAKMMDAVRKRRLHYEPGNWDSPVEVRAKDTAPAFAEPVTSLLAPPTGNHSGKAKTGDFDSS